MPVVTMHGDEIINDRGVNPQCVAAARSLIAKARAGEIVGFVGAVQFADGSTGELYGGFIRQRPIIGVLMERVAHLSRE